jgi:hypothetical protein
MRFLSNFSYFQGLHLFCLLVNRKGLSPTVSSAKFHIDMLGMLK